MDDKNSQMVHLRLSNYMYNGLNVIKNKNGMTISSLVRSGINDVLKKELSQKELNKLKNL